MSHSIAVLGSTGSIGRQTLEVAGFLGLGVEALAAAGNNIGLLLGQTRTFMPGIVAVSDAAAAGALASAMDGDRELRRALRDGRVEILHGADGLRAAASQSGADTVAVGVTGVAGLSAVIAALEAGKTVALANKESMVMAGRLIMGLSRRRNAPVLPVDSEHSAIFQCLLGRGGDALKRIILTASGGPFRGYKPSGLEGVTPEQAMAHPVWKMGRKISIDSSTLTNKGLEIIEASRLFGVSPDKIDVLIHPEGVIHSMVEFIDNSVFAQMGAPDMRAPIQYALTYPDRRPGLTEAVDFCATGKLTFEKPDTDSFPCLALAYEAARAGGTMPAVYNAANEAAVERFTGGSAGFNDIPILIERAMARHIPADDMLLDNIYAADREARKTVMETM